MVRNGMMKADPGMMAQVHKEIQRALQSSGDIKGLVPSSALRGPDGVVEKSGDTELMLRVCKALVHELQTSEKEDDEYSVERALKAAGCPVEMYAEMAIQPDFREILEQTTEAFVVLPRWVKIRASLSKLAESGDIQAAKMLSRQENLNKLSDVTQLVEQFNKDGGGDRFAREIEMRIQQLREMLDAFKASRPPPGAIEKARERVGEVKSPKARFTMDPKKVFGLSTEDDAIKEEDDLL